MMLNSLRFSDTLDVEAIFKTDTVLDGRSVDQKNPRGALLAWAIPRV